MLTISKDQEKKNENNYSSYIMHLKMYVLFNSVQKRALSISPQHYRVFGIQVKR